MGPPSKISETWFGPGFRTTATAIIIAANNFGGTIGFLFCPWVVKSADDVATLLYYQVAFAAVPFVLIFIYFPQQPPTYASFSAMQRDAGSDANTAARRARSASKLRPQQQQTAGGHAGGTCRTPLLKGARAHAPRDAAGAVASAGYWVRTPGLGPR